MAHSVICTICNTRFDRDKEAYAVAPKGRRYMHAACALREHEKNPDQPKPQIVDPTDNVTCIYCKQTFNKSQTPFKLFSNGKYAHQTCVELEEKRELTEQEKLEKYIMQLFGTDYVYARIQKQIKDYVTNHGFTYSGIRKALIYYYEIKVLSLNLLPSVVQNSNAELLHTIRELKEISIDEINKMTTKR